MVRKKKSFTGNEALDWVLIIAIAILYLAFWIEVGKEWLGLAIFVPIFLMYWHND